MGGCMGTSREPSVNVASGDPLATSTGGKESHLFLCIEV